MDNMQWSAEDREFLDHIDAKMREWRQSVHYFQWTVVTVAILLLMLGIGFMAYQAG